MGASKIKNLAKDTAIYGLSSIIGRFLNWLLVPFYTFVFTEIELGTIQNIYAYVAFSIIILTFGMETTFFRFMNQETTKEKTQYIYSTILIFIGTICLIFTASVFFFIDPLSRSMGYDDHKSYLLIMAVTVAFDAFLSIPFAFLRYSKRPIRFASLKVIQIALSIGLNLFFLLLCPKLMNSSHSHLVSWFYDPDSMVRYTFLANMIASIFITLVLIPYYIGIPFRFDFSIFPKMIKYALPLVLLGIVGILNQTIDKILYPSFLYSTKSEGLYWLGLYTAGAKVAVVMTMFTQAFRFAYEPFVFAEKKDKDSKELYSRSMTYFVVFALLILLAISYYLEVLKFIISPKFFSGLEVVPLVMIGELFFGVYFNLSIWFKLTDKTIFGAYFSIIGFILIVAVNIIFVPIYGIIATAWANFICYFGMSIISYLVGRKFYPIPYQIKRMLLYGVLCFALFQIGMHIPIEHRVIRLLFRTVLLIIFALVALQNETKINFLSFFKQKKV